MLRAFGDSITEGVLVPPENSYIGLLQKWRGSGIANMGKAGDWAHHQTQKIYRTQTALDDVSLYMVGTNDLLQNGGNEAHRASYFDTLLAQIAWLACGDRTAAAIPGAVSVTGNWRRDWHYGIGIVSTGGWASATFVVEGDVAYIGMRISQRSGAAFSVLMDGQILFSHTPQSAEPSENGESFEPALLALTGLGHHSHRIDIVVSGEADSAGGELYFDWFGTPKRGGRVIQGGIIRCGSEIYRSYNASEEECIAYNEASREAVKILAGHGLDVQFVEIFSSLNPLSDLLPDGIHPSSAGHYLLAERFRQVLERPVSPRFKTRVSPHRV